MAEERLTGRVAIVTGAGSRIGFGRSMTLALVEAGARVAMVDVNEQALDQTAGEARDVGGPNCVVPVLADVSRPEDARRVVERTVAELGGLHVLVNNAGTNARNLGFTSSEDAPFWELPAEAWFRVAAINYIGPALMASAAVKHMLDQKWGRIIGVTTSLDTMYLKGNPSYGSSKAGHEAFMASIAQELEGSGVTVNVLVPGGPANTNLFPPDTPLDRKALIQPAVMQAPMVWLASDDSNAFHNRRVIAYHWDETLPLEERLAKAAAPLAWQQLGRQAIRPAS
ncbi:MAG: SDR family oxidoreductase [Chloroflexota bacterium]|nr:SDR family oxidoreductase [Chloroflexota bacterium]